MKLEADPMVQTEHNRLRDGPWDSLFFSHSRVHSLRHSPPPGPPGSCHPPVPLEGMFFLGIHPGAIHAQLRSFVPFRFHPSSASKFIRDFISPLRLLNAVSIQ